MRSSLSLSQPAPATSRSRPRSRELEGEASGEVVLVGLRERAFQAALSTPQAAGTAARRRLYRRSAAVRRYVLARAARICESCEEPAPFVIPQGEPYLEPYHTRRLSDGGPDDPRFVGAVCPDCHREIHHGMHGQAKNEALIEVVRQKEKISGA
jgi:5-methylcytosine-specific restriction protein A